MLKINVIDDCNFNRNIVWTLVVKGDLGTFKGEKIKLELNLFFKPNKNAFK